MRPWLAVAVVGCTHAQPTPAPVPVVPAPAPPVAVITPPPAATIPLCDLHGKYRLRFRSNGSEGFWLRFTYEGTTTTLTQPAEMLDLPAGPIGMIADPIPCTLTLSATTQHAGDITIALKVDPVTTAVTGTLTRTKVVAPDDSPAPVSGAHDRTPPVLGAGDACIAPGIYELVPAPKHKWKNADASDSRSCKRAGADLGKLYLRVEWLGDELAIDSVDSKAPWAADAFTSETVTRVAPCEVDVALESSSTKLGAKLDFEEGKATGTATAKHQMVVETEMSEDIWMCETKALPLTAKRIATPD